VAVVVGSCFRRTRSGRSVGAVSAAKDIYPQGRDRGSGASVGGQMRIIVTGGNSGVGKATAATLAAAGHSVVIACRTIPKAESGRVTKTVTYRCSRPVLGRDSALNAEVQRLGVTVFTSEVHLRSPRAELGAGQSEVHLRSPRAELGAGQTRHRQ
jgi:hypothetical protein